MNALEIKGLTKIYATGTQALKGIDLCVEEGDFFALLGPNGAGKSTTIGIITSLVQRTSGEVKIFGYDIEQQAALAKSKIGIVPQEFNFNIFYTCEDILVNQAGYYGVPRKLAKQRAEYFLKKLDLWEKRKQVVRFLSGGQKRRLMVARALMHQPPLLILDEPTAGVDIEIRRSMWQFLEEMNKNGVTIILTTHYLEEAENLCRNVAIIHNGLLIENSSIKNVLSKLHMESFVLNLENPILDNQIANISYPIRKLDEKTLEIDMQKGQTLNDLFAVLSNQHIEVTSMRNKTNRLEELFIRLISNPHSEVKDFLG